VAGHLIVLDRKALTDEALVDDKCRPVAATLPPPLKERGMIAGSLTSLLWDFILNFRVTLMGYRKVTVLANLSLLWRRW